MYILVIHVRGETAFLMCETTDFIDNKDFICNETYEMASEGVDLTTGGQQDGVVTARGHLDDVTLYSHLHRLATETHTHPDRCFYLAQIIILLQSK